MRPTFNSIPSDNNLNQRVLCVQLLLSSRTAAVDNSDSRKRAAGEWAWLLLLLWGLEQPIGELHHHYYSL